MNGMDLDLVALSGSAVMILLFVGIFLSFIRLVRGPSIADRVVALDLIAILAVGVIAIYAVQTNHPLYLRAAIVVGLVTYLGTVAFAYFIHKGGRP